MTTTITTTTTTTTACCCYLYSAICNVRNRATDTRKQILDLFHGQSTSPFYARVRAWSQKLEIFKTTGQKKNHHQPSTINKKKRRKDAGRKTQTATIRQWMC
ncbi:conserved hypothetical protein [Trichinella spiralis]|uniref:hypothetical protein n=1 Tax=Trichinella spiralis TaxID=6334 RepID=UPI0001EFB547|nr:conserved hypothetical protein [Trichinella spiralis]